MHLHVVRFADLQNKLGDDDDLEKKGMMGGDEDDMNLRASFATQPTKNFE